MIRILSTSLSIFIVIKYAINSNEVDYKGKEDSQRPLMTPGNGYLNFHTSQGLQEVNPENMSFIPDDYHQIGNISNLANQLTNNFQNLYIDPQNPFAMTSPFFPWPGFPFYFNPGFLIPYYGSPINGGAPSNTTSSNSKSNESSDSNQRHNSSQSEYANSINPNPYAPDSRSNSSNSPLSRNVSPDTDNESLILSSQKQKNLDNSASKYGRADNFQSQTTNSSSLKKSNNESSVTTNHSNNYSHTKRTNSNLQLAERLKSKYYYDNESLINNLIKIFKRIDITNYYMESNPLEDGKEKRKKYSNEQSNKFDDGEIVRGEFEFYFLLLQIKELEKDEGNEKYPEVIYCFIDIKMKLSEGKIESRDVSRLDFDLKVHYAKGTNNIPSIHRYIKNPNNISNHERRSNPNEDDELMFVSMREYYLNVRDQKFFKNDKNRFNFYDFDKFVEGFSINRNRNINIKKIKREFSIEKSIDDIESNWFKICLANFYQDGIDKKLYFRLPLFPNDSTRKRLIVNIENYEEVTQIDLGKKIDVSNDLFFLTKTQFYALLEKAKIED